MTSAFTQGFKAADDDLMRKGYFESSSEQLEEVLKPYDWRLMEIMAYRGRIEMADIEAQEQGLEDIKQLLKEADISGDKVLCSLILKKLGATDRLAAKAVEVPIGYYNNHIKPLAQIRPRAQGYYDGGDTKNIATLLKDYLQEMGKIE